METQEPGPFLFPGNSLVALNLFRGSSNPPVSFDHGNQPLSLERYIGGAMQTVGASCTRAQGQLVILRCISLSPCPLLSSVRFAFGLADFRYASLPAKGELMPMRAGAVNKPDLLNDYINATVAGD